MVLSILVEVSVYDDDVFKRQVMTNMNKIEPIVGMFEDYEHNEKLQEQLVNYIDGISQGDSVWVSDLDDNKIWVNSVKSPNVDDIVNLEFFDTMMFK